MINRIGLTNNKCFYKISRGKALEEKSCNQSDNRVLAFPCNDYKVLTSLSFGGLAEIARRKAKYPEDHLYRTELARNLRCKPDALMSVLGEQEFKDLLSKLKSQDYVVGDNYANVDKGLIKANLHTHTTDSDGRITVETLLEQAVKYADRMKNPPFIFSVTNHDVLVDTIKVLNLIAKNPDKYKNIRFVPGIEITAKYKNNDILVKPILVEFLSYCLNPFDKEINTFLKANRDCNLAYARDITEEAVKLGLKVDFDQLVKENRYIEINGNLYILRKYLLKIAKQAGMDESIISKLFEKHRDQYGSILISKATPSIQDIGKTFKESVLTMAHPGRYGFYDPADQSTIEHLPKRINKYKLHKGMNPEQALKVFMKEFKKAGGVAVEAYYQYGTRYPDLKTNPWLLSIKKVVEEIGFIKTGGTDTHRETLFALN